MLAKILAPALIVAAGALTIAATTSTAQDPMMEQPTDHHKIVQRAVGDWKGTLTSYMPGMPETPMPATEHTDAVGGFWTNTTFQCDFMGMPYKGVGVVGYSAKDKKFLGTWTDSTSSFFAMMEGDYDKEKDILTMRWTGPDMTGAMVPHRYEVAMRDDGYTSTFFVGENGGEKSMVIEMERVKGDK